MANTWTTFRAAVEAAVTSAMPSAVASPANGDGPTVSWFDAARPYGKHRILLQEVSTVQEFDRDSALYEGGAQSLSSVLSITLQVQCESQHDDPTLNALWLIEQVRLGLRKVSVREALAAAGVVIATFPGQTTRRTFISDDRAVTAASFDVTFRAEFTFDASDEDAGLIERVEGEGTGELADIEIAVDHPNPQP